MTFPLDRIDVPSHTVVVIITYSTCASLYALYPANDFAIHNVLVSLVADFEVRFLQVANYLQYIVFSFRLYPSICCVVFTFILPYKF